LEPAGELTPQWYAMCLALPFRRPRHARGNGLPFCRAGFTLIELIFVIAIIGMILAVAIPRLMPAFLFSQLEGSARHVANYGRSAIAYAAMRHEDITIRFDLASGEYRALRWRDEYDDFFGDGDRPSQHNLSGGSFSSSRYENDELLMRGIEQVMALGNTGQASEEALRIQWQIDQSFRRSLKAQARNVKREGILSEIGPLFDKPFELDEESEEENREEVTDPLLDAVVLPQGIVIDSIVVQGLEYKEGVVDIEISPLGLSESVIIYLRNEGEEYYTVQWDPITGGAHIISGKELPL
jgi:prepilin-type N-terminal cleavage/methylation domain-containing protein